MTVQAVFFDMGGTIETLSSTPELRLQAARGLQQRLHSAGIDLPLSAEKFLEVVTTGFKHYQQDKIVSLQELPPVQVWREYILSDYLVDYESLGNIAEDLMFFYETHFYQRRMRDEMPEVLQAIQDMGLKIGLISNVNSHGQVPTNLKQYGIINYFNPIVLSSVYGRRKPDPSIFHYAARMAQVPTSHCIYIGDRIARDILGARKAGYAQAILIKHDFDHGEDDYGAKPDAIITHMSELLGWLKSRPIHRNNKVSIAGRSTKPIRAFFFDAGDVLYYRPNRWKKFKPFLQKLSLSVDDSHLFQKDVLANQAFRGEITQDQFRERLLRVFGVTDAEDIERGKQILDDEDHDIRYFEGVASTLKSLKRQGYLLGIITDTANPVYVKLDWFEKGGFGHVWDTIISSKEVGVRKPHPDIYQTALQQLDVMPGEAVFVGHKPSELDGARAVGMHTVAFNYEPGAKAEVYISHFADLLELPARMNGEVETRKISLSTMWAMGRYAHLEDFIQEAQQLGFDQVELNHHVDTEMLASIDLLRAPISSLHEPCPADIPVEVLKTHDWMISASDEECRKKGVEAIQHTIEMAGEIGVRHVVVHAGNVRVDWPDEKELFNMFKAGQSQTGRYQELKARLIDQRAVLVPARLAAVQKSIVELVDIARPLGVRLGLENRYHYMDIPLPDEMELLFRLAEPEVLGFWYDVGHAQALDRLGFAPHQSWLDRFTHRMIGVHLHDVIGIQDHNAPGLGEVDFIHILANLPAQVVVTLEVSPSLSSNQVHVSLQYLMQHWRQEKTYETL